MANLYVQESYVNLDKEVRYEETPIYETFTDDRGELYRSCMRAFGRCVSKVYVGDGEPVGWVFVKRVEYDDSNKTYLREVWVTVYDAAP